MTSSELWVVVMAGGSGTRFWPLSRQARPKQILKLLNGRTLLRECFDRLADIFDPRSILVLTNTSYVDQVRENLSELPEENVIPEPCVRDTSGAIGLSASILTKVDPEMEAKAIGSHDTATASGPWDAAANERRLEGGEDTLRRAYAWVDPEGDPDVKASYRFRM